MADLCPCGCGRPVPAGRRYADYERCRQRAYRQKVEAEARAAGRETRLNLETVRSTLRSGSRSNDAQRPARKPRAGASIYVSGADELRMVMGALEGRVPHETLVKFARAAARLAKRTARE